MLSATEPIHHTQNVGLLSIKEILCLCNIMMNNGGNSRLLLSDFKLSILMRHCNITLCQTLCRDIIAQCPSTQVERRDNQQETSPNLL